MSTTKKGSQRIEKIKLIVEVAVVVISIMSLFLAWQANQISKKNAQPQILFLDTFPGGFEKWTDDNFDTAMCRTRVRLANVGGVDTDLFSASVKAETKTSSSIVPVSEFITSKRTERLEEDIVLFASIWKHLSDDTRDPTVIWKDGLYNDLPISLKSHTTSNIYVDTYFRHSVDEYDFNSISLSPLIDDTFSSLIPLDETSSPFGYELIRVSFIFQFPDESTITTNSTKCAYYK